MFTIVRTPDRPPHQCISCGGGQERDFYIDLGEDNNSPENVMPSVYLCNLCLAAAGKEVGLVDQTPLMDEIKQLRETVFDLTVKAEGLENGLNGLIRARFFPPDTPAVRDALDRLPLDQDADGAGGEEGSGTAPVVPGEGSPVPGADRGAPQQGAVPDVGPVRPSLLGNAGDWA